MNTVHIKNIKQFAVRYPASRLAEILRSLPDEVPAIQLPGLVEVWTSILDSEAERK